jgi:hypothetical protein
MKIGGVTRPALPEVTASRFACFRDHRGFSTEHCRASEIGSHDDQECLARCRVKKNAVQLEADGRARDRLQLDRLRQSRAYADETAEALRRTQVRLDQETESLKLLERQLRLTEERLNQSVREANQVWVAYQELRAYVDRLKAHPVLGLALTGRREVRNLVSRFKARLHAE